MLYTLTLHSAICQLYLNKTERKKIKTNNFLKNHTSPKLNTDETDNLNSPLSIKKKKKLNP